MQSIYHFLLDCLWEGFNDYIRGNVLWLVGGGGGGDCGKSRGILGMWGTTFREGRERGRTGRVRLGWGSFGSSCSFADMERIFGVHATSIFFYAWASLPIMQSELYSSSDSARLSADFGLASLIQEDKGEELKYWSYGSAHGGSGPD